MILVQSILCLILMPAYLSNLNPEFVGFVPLLILQVVFCLVGIWLFIDSTFLRRNSSRVGIDVTILVLALLYIVLLMVFSVFTRDNRLAYIAANPSDFNSEAAIATAISEAHTLCTKQLIFFSLALPFVVGLIPLTVLKALNGEARTPFYVCLGLAIAFTFFGMYASINVLEVLATISPSSWAQIVESRSIVVYIACAGAVALNSDFDPDLGKATTKDF